MGKPWHMIPAALRESAIANMEVDGDEGCTCPDFVAQARGGCYSDCAARSEMFRAAAKVLRDAAPYPDEALMFDFDGTHVQFIDFGWQDMGCDPMPNAWVCEDEDGTEAPFHPSELRPLTIAAEEFWREMGGGE